MSTRLETALDRSPLQARSRVLTKTLLYRCLMVAITVLVALLVTGNSATRSTSGSQPTS